MSFWCKGYSFNEGGMLNMVIKNSIGRLTLAAMLMGMVSMDAMALTAQGFVIGVRDPDTKIDFGVGAKYVWGQKVEVYVAATSPGAEISAANPVDFMSQMIGSPSACNLTNENRSEANASVVVEFLHGTDATHTCKLAVVRPAFGAFSPADYPVSFTVGKKTPRDITSDAGGSSIKYGSAPQTFTINSSPDLNTPLQVTSSNTTVCSFTQNANTVTVTPKAIGTCTLNAKNIGNLDYFDANKAFSITIEKGISTISSSNIKSEMAVGESASFAIQTTGSKAKPGVGGSASPTGACEVSRINDFSYLLKALAPGVCTVDLKLDPIKGDSIDNNYLNAINTYQVEIKKKQSVSIVGLPASLDVGAAVNFTVMADAAPGVSPLISSSDPSVCRLTGNSATGAWRLEALRGNSCKVSALLAGNAEYVKAEAIHTVQIVKKTIPIDIVPPLGLKVGPAVEVKVSGDTPNSRVRLISKTPTVCTVVPGPNDGFLLNPLKAQTCILEADRPDDGYAYAAGPVTRSILTAKGLQTPQVLFMGRLGYMRDGIYDDLKVTGGASGNPVELTVLPDANARCSMSNPLRTENALTVKLLGIGRGTCTVYYSQAGNDDWEPGSINIPLDVKYYQLVGFENTYTKIGMGAQLEVNLKPTISQIEPTLHSRNPEYCNVLKTDVRKYQVMAIKLTPSGQACRLVASLTGNNDYAPSEDYFMDLAVVKGSQTINFTALPDETLDRKQLTISASASSGLPLTLSATPATVCSLSGNQLNLLSVGDCSVTASQQGDADYDAAVSVTRSMTVRLPASTTQLSVNPERIMVRKPVTFTATVASANATPTGSVSFYLNGSGISACSNLQLVNGAATCLQNSLPAGQHKVRVVYAGNANFSSSESSMDINVNSLDWLPTLMDMMLN
ncbi:Ig-like domain-containing protein [Massilia sp. W12]|uniref:Ig-like domain-containing protein n=1 Tax=Massilia sp. W12 TaxID=3126507 RepID=UPI0030D49FDE